MDNQDVIATLNDLLETTAMGNKASARVPKALRALISRRCSTQRRGAVRRGRGRIGSQGSQSRR
jgi:hypothetical protein